MQAKVYPFPRRVQRTCAVCAIPLPRLLPAWHSLCRQCFQYARFGRAVEMFRAVRP